MEIKTYSISKLARLFGLSRSTLLYYDRIGLLPPSGRTSSGYRIYTREDADRLERICNLRRTGLSLKDVMSMMRSQEEPGVALLERRLEEINDAILDLKAKQELIACMIKGVASGATQPKVDKAMWVEMLRAAGMDDNAMRAWHAEFELRAPESHHKFLLSLGIAEKEIALIRQWSRKSKQGDGNSGCSRDPT